MVPGGGVGVEVVLTGGSRWWCGGGGGADRWFQVVRKE